jgi:hypothetical protein
MRKSFWIALAFAALLVAIIIGVLLCKCIDDFRPGPREQPKLALPLPKGTPQAPSGMKALTVKPGPEPFTLDDVTAYFQTHNLPRNLGSNSDFRVERLEFVTTREVKTRLAGASPGLSDETRVAFATLRGTFIFTGPPGARTVRFERAYALFSMTTGNLLMVGTLDSGAPQQTR